MLWASNAERGTERESANHQRQKRRRRRNNCDLFVSLLSNRMSWVDESGDKLTAGLPKSDLIENANVDEARKPNVPPCK
jgi:hypothetical protein